MTEQLQTDPDKAHLHWYLRPQPNYELRLYTEIGEYVAVECKLNSTEDFQELVEYAQFVINRGPELLRSVVYNESMQQDTDEGVRYWPTWSDFVVTVDLNDVDNFNFHKWYINRTSDYEQVAHGDDALVKYDEISDALVGKYAIMEAMV